MIIELVLLSSAAIHAQCSIDQTLERIMDFNINLKLLDLTLKIVSLNVGMIELVLLNPSHTTLIPILEYLYLIIKTYQSVVLPDLLA